MVRHGVFTTAVAAAAALAFTALAGGSVAAPPPQGALTQLRAHTVCDTLTAAKPCKPVRGLSGPRALALSPDGRTVYVAAEGASALVALTRNPRTGALTQPAGAGGCASSAEDRCAAVAPLAGARDAAVSRDGRHVYVAAPDSDAVTSFARNARTGALLAGAGQWRCVASDPAAIEEEPCADARLVGGAQSLALTRDGRHLYVVGTHGLAAFARDAASGALGQLAGAAGCVSSDGTDPHDRDVGEDEAGFDPVVCGVSEAIVGSADVAASADGRHVYVAAAATSAVIAFGRDAGSGALQGGACVTSDEDSAGGACAPVRGLSGAAALTVSGDGRHVYVAAPLANAVVVLNRDAASGALAEVAGAAGCVHTAGAVVPVEGACATATGLVQPSELELSPDGRTLYAVAENALVVFARDPRTGALRQLARPHGCVATTTLGRRCVAARGVAGLAAAAVTPDGRHVYTAAGTAEDGARAPFSNAVATFARGIARR